MGVLLMLMTIGGLILAAVLFGIAWLNDSTWLRKFVLGGVAVWLIFYIVMLLGFSFASTEKTLPIGEAKEYCGFYLDCHMHTTVTNVTRTKTLGNKTANGEFYIVSVKVFSNAKRATLGLLSVDAHVADANGQTYTRDMQAETQLPPQPDFERQITPSETFEKQIVFDLPIDVQNPRLDMREGYGIDHVIEAVLIDDEDSIFHKRNYFALSEPPAVAGGLTEPMRN
ncbi:MAG TPA: DUF4352 domain-containing protein [Pyrinomonadaceae bacterium]|nr:DUF4352 domain-containing protein [Pyrinomonadaceae bacterium]